MGQAKLEDAARKAVAIVGVGAVMPDAPDAETFWRNIRDGHSSIREIPAEGYWDPALYYDADPKAPDKTYTTIGGFATDWAWEPLKWKLPIPPKVSAQMDRGQKWAIMCARQALMDYGLERPLDKERTGVILGNAMAGDLHYYTATRILTPEIVRELQRAPSFASLSADLKQRITQEVFENVQAHLPPVNEDTMPGELSNIIAGRVAAMFDLNGPNFVTDAACASAMAAVSAACEGLTEGRYDAVLSGGVDANMNPSSFIKFCKIGALSATGSRPFDQDADGFVMGEGAALFLLKRLADAERDGDKIYAVIRGIGGSSDGKGKGITAPNPAGQQYAVARGWENAGRIPDRGTMIEGHGTSTRVGDVAEADSLIGVLARYNLDQGSIPIGSVKSNIGHLKAGAGAAGLFKAALALHHKELPPSLNFKTPNPKIDFGKAPFYVNHSFQQWDKKDAEVRSAGVSSFGFGGTNFHIVLEEHVPGRIASRQPVVGVPSAAPVGSGAPPVAVKAPLRGALTLCGESKEAVKTLAEKTLAALESGTLPEKRAPKAEELRAAHRLVIDWGEADELKKKLPGAIRALGGADAMWNALKAQGVFYGSGPAPKVAFLYTGQGSQYVNMMRQLRDVEPVVREVFEDADKTMTPLLGKPLTDYIYVDPNDEGAVKQATKDLMQTAITQPAVLATDQSLTKLMAAYGVEPDMVMGHSLGEYGALVAAGALPFADALEAVSARGREMTKVSVEDNGLMAAVFAPIEEIEAILAEIDDYVVIANINSGKQAVIGGGTAGVQTAVKAIEARGYTARLLPVSHAFHTSIVAPASGPLQEVLRRLDVRAPQIPLVANTTGTFYPMHPGVKGEIVDILGEQIASPVQFVKGLHTLYEAGCRIFVEMGPKKALAGFVEDVLGGHGDVLALFSNHPKQGDITAFNQALCGLYAAGLGIGEEPRAEAPAPSPTVAPVATAPAPMVAAPSQGTVASAGLPATPASGLNAGQYQELGQIFAEFIDKGLRAYAGGGGGGGQPQRSVTITGAAVGLPGLERVFDERNVERLLGGQQLIGSIPPHLRKAQIDKRVVRLVKDPITGSGKFVTLESPTDALKLAGRPGKVDLPEEFGYPKDRMAALDIASELVIGAGIQALRDAGIPLVRTYKTTTKGTKLPDRWMLPECMRDDTGVIFGSAFPGYESYADEMRRYYGDQRRRAVLAELESLRARIGGSLDLDARIESLRDEVEREAYNFDRRFIFKILAMGHSQFAEYIGARGPNTQINAACASGTQGVGLAHDWIQSGRCRRVIVLSADSVTSENLMEWIGAGFLATGAAATDEVVEEAALPFDRRRHGLLLGMGAAAVVVEDGNAAAERGVRPVSEVLETSIANSAFHGSRLDVAHVTGVIEAMVSRAERRWGVSRQEMAEQMVFVSHETFTPARGGSAQAEVNALREVFGPQMDRVVVANTKGLTGHAMGTGIEDVLAVKALETGVVPPVPNFKEVDPDLGTLNLAKGGSYPIRYALRLAAGFGSQVSLTLQRLIPSADGRRPTPQQLGFNYRTDMDTWSRWLAEATGYDAPEPEVVKNTLRVKEQGPPKRAPKAAIPLEDAGAPQHAGAVASPVAASPAVVAPRPVTAPAPAPAAIATPAPAPNPAPAPAPAPAAPVVDPVVQQVMAIIAEQTGYPPEMLDIELDLEADLGIDTVKQAETFAAVRSAYDIERDDSVQLRDFPTIKHVVEFVRSRRPDLVAAAPAAPAPAPTAAPAAAPTSATDPVVEKVLSIIAEQTGYPTDMLDIELDLEADLGVDTVKQAETFAAVREAYDIQRDDAIQLRDFPTIKHVVEFVRSKRPDLAVAVTPAPAPVAAPAAAAAPAPTVNPVAQKVIEIVAEQTGYPPDMLDMDLDLEADLGIDTVKQAETFAAVREAFGIERVENMQLRDFPTMKHVVQFVFDHKPELASQVVAAPAAPAPVAPAPAAPAPAGADPVTQRVIAIIAEQTGYPEDMLDLDLDLEADLGIDTVKQAETFAAVREAFGIERVENLQLRDFPTMKHVIGFVYDHKPELRPAPGAAPAAPTAVAPSVAAPAAAEPVTQKVIAIIAEQTGYPEDMLDLDLDLEADLGIDTVKQAETFAAVREAFGIERVENLQLRDFPTMKHVIGFVYDHKPELRPAAAPAAAAPATTQAAPAAPAAPEGGQRGVVEAKVVAIIAEQTGYPEDMLDLDLDLEADLGIDTVKQAETFAAVREAFGIERVENLQLRDFPTMKHVIGFVYDHKPELRDGGSAAASTAAPASAEAPAAATILEGSMDAAASIPRRVPVPTLRPPLSLCKPTGVELGAGKRVVVMADEAGTIADGLCAALESREVSVLRIDDRPRADELVARLEGWIGEGAIDGVYWLPGFEDHGDFTALEIDDYKEALRVRVKLLYAAMRALYEQVQGAGTFLVSAVALGGQHGYDEAGATRPLGGAVTGFTKAYKRERPEALVKAVDFPAETEAEPLVEALLAETLADPGVVEIGHRDGDRWTVGLREMPLDEAQGLDLGDDSVFIVTGAAGSIVSAITADLAKAAAGTFYLLDLTPEPDPQNPDLQRFSSDKDGLKRDIFARLKASGERATPKLVDRELAGLERQQSALAGIEAIRAAGGTAEYRSVNLMDGEAVRAVVEEIRDEHGRVDVLLHAAGLEISRFLPDKEPGEFDLVFDVKADGWFHLLSAMGDMPLAATVSFSSIAGRFGNGGQTDYSSANDLLCKTSSSFRGERPQTRGVALDWTAWGGIGMAARGSIPKMMELARIDMLPPEAGIPMVRRELTFAPVGAEVVVAQGLGIMLDEFDATGGLDAETVNTPSKDLMPSRPMAAHVVGMGLYSGLTVETELDPEEQPFLYDHQIDGTPVLPGVMGIEAFGELAKVLFPDWHVAAVEDVTFLAPFKFYRNQRRKLSLHASFSRVAEDVLCADCVLVGKRKLPNAEEPVETRHFAARVRLQRSALPEETVDVPKSADGPEVAKDAIYDVYFHGPAYQVIEKAWRSNGAVVALLPQTLPEDQKPTARQEMLPRLIELCFQTAGLWEIGKTGKMGLPNRVEQVSVLRDVGQAEGRLFSVVTPREDGRSFDAIVADEAGHVFVKLGGYRTVELPGGVDEEKRKPLQSAME